MKTIELYHGTIRKFLPEILEKGVLPRDVTGRSNYKGKIVSKAGLVYLSTAYPVYFAMNAGSHEELAGDQGDLAIIKVRVPVSRLYPDEDFIGNALSLSKPNRTTEEVAEIIETVDPVRFRKYWQDSIDKWGTCASKPISPDQIIGHTIIPLAEAGLIFSIGADSIPGAMNYLHCGAFYQEALQLLLAEGLDAVKAKLDTGWCVATHNLSPEALASFNKMMQQVQEQR